MFPTPPAQAAIQWADRLYAHVSPLPSENPCYVIDEALGAYRQVAKKYPSKRAAEGIGNCLMLLGHYGEAAKVYPESSRRQEALRYLSVAQAAAPFAKGRSVLQVAPVPGAKDRWIAIVANAKPGRGEGVNYVYPEVLHISLIQLLIAHGKAVSVGETRVASGTGDPDWCLSASMYVTNLEVGRRLAVMVYRDRGGADHDTTLQQFYSIGPDTLRPIWTLWGDLPSSVYPAKRRRGLLVQTLATWKVWWPDVYEWRHGHFTLANDRHLEHYPTSLWRKRERSYPFEYSDFVTNATLETIWGHPRKAIRLWKQAERLCISYVHDPQYQEHGIGYYGGAEENLVEIRQRIRWLRRGEMNHMLLYRPYDWDLEVAPYKLGKAGP